MNVIWLVTVPMTGRARLVHVQALAENYLATEANWFRAAQKIPVGLDQQESVTLATQILRSRPTDITSTG